MDLSGGYLWFKALHVISVIAWMAGLFYLPRLFVYHAVEPKGSAPSELFKVMERRLYRAIMMPSMIASWLFGLLTIAAVPGFLEQPWMHAKLLFVTLLTVVHFVLEGHRKAFAVDANTRPQKYYRVINEVPTVLMIGIVIFVIVRPW